MKEGMPLQELAEELIRQGNSRRDFIADTRQIRFCPAAEPCIRIGEEDFGIRELAHDQIADTLSIPRKYYEKMRKELPQLLAENANAWFNYDAKPRMLRTLDGKVRAFLSSRYRRLDNLDLACVTLPVLKEANAEIRSCNITEGYFYLKAVTQEIEGEVSVGDVVRAGICIRNSEVGLARLSVSPMLERLVCKNGMVVDDYAMKQVHVGRKVGAEEPTELFSDETLAADDKAFWYKVRDVVTVAISDREHFLKIVETAKNARDTKINVPPQKSVQELQKRFSLQDSEGEQVLTHLLRGGELNQFGMSQAVSRTSQDVVSYDRASELEVLSGRIITLPQEAWKTIAEY